MSNRKEKTFWFPSDCQIGEQGREIWRWFAATEPEKAIRASFSYTYVRDEGKKILRWDCVVFYPD